MSVRSSRSIWRAFRRLGWGAADQAFSSLTNFALGVAVARSVGPEEFGAFSIAFVTYSVSLGLVHSASSDVLAVRFSTSSEDRWREGTASATGAAIVIGLLTGLLCVLASLVLDGPLGEALLVLGPALPALFLQDTWRYALFSGQRPQSAFANDLLWALVLFPALAVLLGSGRHSISWLMFAWEASAAICAAFGILQAKVVPRPGLTRGWLAEHRDLSAFYLGEFAAVRGSNQLATYGIALFGGLGAAGAVRGGMLLLNPLNVFFMGFGKVAVPEGVRLLERSVEKLRARSIMLSVGLACVAIGWGVVAHLLPSPVGRALLGATWPQARQVIVPLSITMAGFAVTIGATTAVRSLTAVRRGLAARVIVAVVKVIVTIAGAKLGGAPGAAWGLAIASCAGAALWWWQCSLALREHELGRRTASTGMAL